MTFFLYTTQILLYIHKKNIPWSFTTTLPAPRWVHDSPLITKQRALLLIWSDSKLLALSISWCCIPSAFLLPVLGKASLPVQHRCSASSLVGLQHRRGHYDLLLDDRLTFRLKYKLKMVPSLHVAYVLTFDLVRSSIHYSLLLCYNVKCFYSAPQMTLYIEFVPSSVITL